MLRNHSVFGGSAFGGGSRGPAGQNHAKMTRVAGLRSPSPVSTAARARAIFSPPVLEGSIGFA